MMNTEDIKKKISNIKKHYDSNLNNSYLKGLTSKLELSPAAQRQISYLLEQEVIYVDTRGAISDLYSAIHAILAYIIELNKKIIPVLKDYGEITRKNYHGNESIYFQMMIKNFPMNLNIFSGMLKELFQILLTYDNEKFSGDEISKSSKDVSAIEECLLRLAVEDRA